MAKLDWEKTNKQNLVYARGGISVYDELPPIGSRADRMRYQNAPKSTQSTQTTQGTNQAKKKKRKTPNSLPQKLGGWKSKIKSQPQTLESEIETYKKHINSKRFYKKSESDKQKTLEPWLIRVNKLITENTNHKAFDKLLLLQKKLNQYLLSGRYTSKARAHGTKPKAHSGHH